ncbi:hypothetical protein O6P43_013171 [Quillaja saponaria]|uniref:Uncharacterized protein n=1 Tax=Quillaja saponaria TaxID=32244 RepID=A0AAD7M3A1_QUISA|nr:hypothetical protein O6P43_013171 [Quillaja saponaria]
MVMLEEVEDEGYQENASNKFTMIYQSFAIPFQISVCRSSHHSFKNLTGMCLAKGQNGYCLKSEVQGSKLLAALDS